MAAILAAGAYFGAASDGLVDRLLDGQLADGGWNCDAPTSTRSSFHSTICVLEGLLEYERAGGTATGVTRRSAPCRKLSARAPYAQIPPLRRGDRPPLDAFLVSDRRGTTTCYAGWTTCAAREPEPDERIAEAVAVVQARRHQNGRWPLNRLHADRKTFDMENGVGRASRWNTLRALRVLRWSRG